ncbi:hypothetical protein F5Y10DRAFT_238460 [Nemania abortiva]|nr:hypothetical protein F5Y10DRAFT_238460 [Nemania abortiva]
MSLSITFFFGDTVIVIGYTEIYKPTKSMHFLIATTSFTNRQRLVIAGLSFILPTPIALSYEPRHYPL